MENVENSLWQKRKQFKYNWSISLDSGCERTPFTQLECLVASAQCLLGVFYLCGYKHSFTFFQFPSHRKRFNLFYVKDMRLCCPPSLGISLESNKVPLVHTFFLWAASVIQFFCFFCLNGSLSIRKRWWMYNNVIKVPLPFDHCFTL